MYQRQYKAEKVSKECYYCLLRIKEYTFVGSFIYEDDQKMPSEEHINKYSTFDLSDYHRGYAHYFAAYPLQTKAV